MTHFIIGARRIIPALNFLYALKAATAAFLGIILLIPFVGYASGYCVVSAERSDANLVEDFLEQLLPKLPKNLAALAPQICFYVNPFEPYANELMSYSAEFDPTYKNPSRAFSQDPKNIAQDHGIKINVTPKFTQMLKFSRVEKEKEFKPDVLGYAGSFIVRSLFIAEKFKSRSLKDLRKDIGSKTFSSSISDIASDHEALVYVLTSAITEQQEFVDAIPGSSNWAFDAGVSNPGFVTEKYLIFNDDGKFVPVDNIVFKGQYRPAQIVAYLSAISSAISSLKNIEIESGISNEEVQKRKAEIKDLQTEFDSYINESEASQILQKFIMIGKDPNEEGYYKLDRFIVDFQSLLQNLPDQVK